MTLRRRLVLTIVAVVAVGLVVVDLITLTSLHSFLYGRVDSQLTTAAHQVAALAERDQLRGEPMTAQQVRDRVSPDVYVVITDQAGTQVMVKPSGSSLLADPPPRMPDPLPVRPLSANTDIDRPSQAYRPAASAVTVGSVIPTSAHHHGAGGPEYRLLAVSIPGRTLVVATRLDSVTATLNSLRALEAGLTVGLLILLVILIAVIARRGLRPLEDMSADADAIAAGDLTRRVHPSDGGTEISRLGRALNGMLAQIETAFAQRAGSEERLRSFLADASHELRTPLTSIQGYAELLRKDALADPASRDRALKRIEQEAARMGVLVGDLAILAREGEGPAPQLTRVDLAAVVAAVVDDARMFDGTRSLELDGPGPIPVLADAPRLEQLVHNLVGNAIAHTPAGTPVDVAVAAEGDQAVLRVRDHGPGMDAEQSERVFDRFYRGTSTTRTSGSGLGLFIVASLARTFGGEASVVSTPGQGSTFTVVLPLDTAESGHVGSPVSPMGPGRNGAPDPAPAGPPPIGPPHVAASHRGIESDGATVRPGSGSTR